jgi:hypothetical protein
MGASASALVAVIVELTTQTSRLEAELAERFEQHPDAKIIRSLPGVGMIIGARVLGEFGDDPNRYADAKSRKNYAGTSPITKASGTRKVVLARYARNRRLADALLPLGLHRSQHQPWSPSLLRPTPSRRRHPPPSPQSRRQPPRRDPPRLSPTRHSPTTNKSPGATDSNSPLDGLEAWDV